jgi:hypothetical protein
LHHWLYSKRRNPHEKQMDELLNILVALVAIMYWYKAKKKAARLMKNKKKDKNVCNAIVTAESMDNFKVIWPEGSTGPAKVPPQSSQVWCT